MRAGQQAFLGTILQTPARGELEVHRGCLILVDERGCIVELQQRGTSIEAELRASGRLTEFEPTQILIPGLVDLHVHAPQWPQLGKALDVPLEIWLQHYTFPLEARYADLDFAKLHYESLVRGMLANGTTTAVYFATIHLPATQLLADICLARGQRALIGRVAMDDAGQCPDYYRDVSAEVAEADTLAFIEYVRGLRGNERDLVLPVVTPRFIPSCSDDLLYRLGALAKQAGCHVQTHCSESDWEHHYVLERCGVTDTAALERFGLLTPKTLLAHGNFVSDDDLARIRQAGGAIAHCPLSNAYFANAALPLRHVLDSHVRVGLGTDIAGGSSPSLFDSARHAVTTSRLLESGVDQDLAPETRGRRQSRISAVEALWLATAAGGMALDLKIGRLTPGYQFDAVLLDTASADSNLHLYPSDTDREVAQKIVHHAGRGDVAAVWVAGRKVSVDNRATLQICPI